MGVIFAWTWPVIAAAATWFVLEFAAKPYLRFRMLRATVQTQLLTLDTTIFVPLSARRGSRAAMIEVHNTEIDRAARALRETGIALVAVADTEWLLNKLLKALDYDLRSAGTALLALPLLIAKRDRKTLSPPFDDKGDELVAIMRKTLHLPGLKLLEPTEK